MSECNDSVEMASRRSCHDSCVDDPVIPSRRRRRRRNAVGELCLASLVAAAVASKSTPLPIVAATQHPAANKMWTRDVRYPMRRSRDRGAKLRGLGWHGSWDEPATSSGKSGKTSKSSSKTGKADHDASWWASSSGDLPVSTPRPTPPPTMRSSPVPPPNKSPTTKSPTKPPTRQPFSSPTVSPTETGSNRPSIAASQLPSISPTIDETALPSGVPTQYQSAAPSLSHSSLPSARPSINASGMPSGVPLAEVGSLEPTPPVLGPAEVPSRFDTVSGNITTSVTPAPMVSPSIANNGTLSPTQEDTSDALSLGELELISPLPLQGIELDLYGLDALDEESQRRYEEQTAAYIASFYNENASDEDDLRSVVSNVTAEVSVTDHRPPEGPTFGFNCADIDPLTVVFSVELTYSSSESDVESGDVVAFPFSKNRFRQQFLYDYLVADSDELSSVQCVSGVYLPSGTEYPTYAPTAGPEEDDASDSPTLLVQSSTPTRASVEMGATDDIFLDMRIGDDVFSDLRLTEPMTKERKCNDKLREVSRDNIDELEVSFVYAVETASDDDSFVGDLEAVLLDFVAVSVLRCSEISKSQAVHKWRSRDSEFNGVVRVRYPEFGELTSRSECEPATSQAKKCLVLTSRFLVTSFGMPESEVHQEALVVLADAFRKGTFAEFVPGVVSLAYLGPDPEAVEYLAASEAGGTGGGTACCFGLHSRQREYWLLLKSLPFGAE
ncbi:hypothetical protein ACHAXT_006091 [Thalassiosira profunda]